MEYRTLSNTEIKVSRLCLGTMTFAEQNTETESHAQLDYALERGINFIDTAEIYPVPPSIETAGLSESYIGTWLKKKGGRDRIVLATKMAGRSQHLPWIRNGKSVFDGENIRRALDESLIRLGTDYIDLYQLHWPDRISNYFGKLDYPYTQKNWDPIPIDETLEHLAREVERGRIRAIGISNETPWGSMQYLQPTHRKTTKNICCIQNPYNLLNRVFEIGLAEMSHKENLPLLAYSPLAMGLLSGKYHAGRNAGHNAGRNVKHTEDENFRLNRFRRHFKRYAGPLPMSMAAQYKKIAMDFALQPAQMALAFVLSRPFVAAAIIGATNLQQLSENIDAASLRLSRDVLKAINAVHNDRPNPVP